ncbi:MAG: class I SAM-dependent methyltransferase [Elainellaceae cyanobacterium]
MLSPYSPSGGSAQPDNPNCALREQLVDHILKQPERRITFADYMDWVLYHPQQGYYTSRVPIGERGDYVTSSSFGSDFGELLAEQFVQLWQGLGQPNQFTLVEQGAGQGLLAADILTYLGRRHPDFMSALAYLIIERSPQLASDQKKRLEAALAYGSRAVWNGLRWCSWSDIPDNALAGCVFSNELVDAFPVHRVKVVAGQLQEIYVAANSGDRRLTEISGDLSTPALRQYFDRLNIGFERHPDGYTTEVNLAALSWLQTISSRLKTGYLLTIDYGHTAARYYQPTRPGTLQCYYRHGHHADPYQNIGHQDITAHVDFTTLQQVGERYGLETIGFTQQGLFLMALGLGDRLSELSQNSDRSINEIIQRRDALHALINPMGLGNFGVLIQGKGLPEEVPLPRGLAIP